ncbi:hypothetical protein [Streptomyces sp. NPDC056983]|uniref:hypothetical protein n=1 Tax=Streptomyces sp. NPDC056983 TaxID=3345987 RepID=UPI0036301BF2
MRELALRVRIPDDVTPGLAVTEAGIVVCVALAVIGDAVTTRSLGERPHLADRLTEPGTALLLGRERRGGGVTVVAGAARTAGAGEPGAGVGERGAGD